MTRKSVKFPTGLRRGPWKTNFLRREPDDRTGPHHILLSASSAERWSNLKAKFRFKSDSELVDYLLTLGEGQPKPISTSDQESDDGWCSSNRSGRKKRGPSLRAVLRRSSRKSGHKSDFISESIESEEFQTEDSCHSVEDAGKRRKFNDNDSKITKFNNYNDILSKKRLDLRSEARKSPNSDEEKEAKANQLDAELALLVESVALQPQKRNENELYEFKDNSESDNGLSCSSPLTENGNRAPKASHRRWKSYHKDKRKWRQSYSAVLPDEVQHAKVKPRTEGSTYLKSEKERKIFKALKKNRILTAYLDSQNKKSDGCSKDSSCPEREDDEVSINEQDERPEAEPMQPSSKKVVDADIVEKIDLTKEKVDVCDVQNQAISSGKENQSKTATSNEPVFIEVGERVKLKRRKKKLLQDSEDSSSNVKDDDTSSIGDWNTTDLERHHRKQRRNWKKSIINYELKEMGLIFKKKKTAPELSPTASNTSHGETNDSPTRVLKTDKDHKPASDENLNVESCNESPRLLPQENDVNEGVVKGEQCPLCCLRHIQQTCPVQYPHHANNDRVSFEQWQLQSQVPVRCSVIEAPRPKPGRLRKSTVGSPSASDIEKRNKEAKTDIESMSYAEESLPPELGLLVVDEDHGKSVVANAYIARYTQFGPLVGPQIHEKDISDESDMRHIWEVLDDKHPIYLNTEDPQKSNWLRFMRPAPEKECRNITLIVRNKQLYFVSIADMPIGTELLYWADDHITSWSKKKILKSSCGGCNMRFAHPLYYRTHCAVFHDPFHSLTIRKYHCKVCGEAVMGKENIMKHAADLHEGRGAYQCQYCHKFFLRLNYLEMHRTYGCSSNPHRTRPLCDFCGRYFCQPQKLKVHIKRMHSDMNEVLREFQCKSCLKILGSRAALQRHFKEVHHRDVVVTSNCDRCGKSFQNRSNLKIHMLTHSGVKPFRCQQDGCSAAFTTKQCLQFHYKKAHGLSEDALPRIERSIAYTFDAYAGEAADGSGSSEKEEVKKPQRVLRKSRKSAKSQKNRSFEEQPIQDENRHERRELRSMMHLDTEEAIESSEPDPQVNHLLQTHPYVPVGDPMAGSDQAESRKFIKSEASQRNHISLEALSYGHEERLLDSGRILTPLQTVTLHAHSEESYHSHHAVQVMTCHSPCESPQSHVGASPRQDLQTIVNLDNKGHKKWLGEVIEVAEEAAAAAMRLSPRLSPHLKRDLYDFDENKVKSKLQYIESPVRQDNQMDGGMGRSKTVSALAPFHHPQSASMLVEAALDAAERDICCPSLAKSSPNPHQMSRSPEPLHLPHASYCVRSPQQEEPSNIIYYTSDLPSASAHDHYLLNHSSHSHSHLHQLDSYVPPPHLSPSRLYSVHSHPVHQHPLPHGPPSSDDEGGIDSDCNSRGECAQNLSLNVKGKMNTRPDTSSMYGVPTHHPEMTVRPSAYHEHLSLSQQNDLSFSGAMVVSSPHYHLYDLSPDRQRPDVTDLTVSSRSLSQGYNSYEDMGGSVDLSVPRSHAPESHIVLAPSPPIYNANLPHQYGPPNVVPVYSPHPVPFQGSPLQRSHVSSSSNSPSASPSPGPTHYHSYPYY